MLGSDFTVCHQQELLTLSEFADPSYRMSLYHLLWSFLLQSSLY
jgi:hypothetical protein